MFRSNGPLQTERRNASNLVVPLNIETSMSTDVQEFSDPTEPCLHANKQSTSPGFLHTGTVNMDKVLRTLSLLGFFPHTLLCM